MIVALVGLCGAGKTEAAKYFENKNYERVYFGGITMEELKKSNLEINEKNERKIREELREKYGMGAYAVLSLPKIELALKEGINVLIDGLYSWTEYKLLRERFPEMITIAIFANPDLRFKRLATREVRRLSVHEAMSRDIAEIENLEKAGPISKADYTIINNGTKEELLQKMKEILG